jgi:hypothetical protein
MIFLSIKKIMTDKIYENIWDFLKYKLLSDPQFLNFSTKHHKQKKIKHTDEEIKEIISQLKTGDIIIFSGQRFASWLIRSLTKSKWTHAGLIVKGKYEVDKKGNVKTSKKENTFILESNANFSLFSDMSGSNKDGVCMTNLFQRLKTLKCNVKFLLLNKPINNITNENGEIIDGEKFIWDWYEKNNNKGFDFSIFFSLPIYSVNENHKYYFCSELITEIYKKLNILPEALLDHRVIPGDFNNYHIKKTKLKNDYQFDKSINFEVKSIDDYGIYIKNVIVLNKK